MTDIRTPKRAITIGAVEDGHYVLRVAGKPHLTQRVPLSPLARAHGYNAEVGALCDVLGTPQVSGRVWNKIKKKAKKAVKKTVATAKRVAKTKLAKTMWSAVKAAAPSPLNQLAAAAETGAKIAKAVKSKNKKTAAKGSRVGKAAAMLAAAKNPSAAQISALAKQAGTSPRTLKEGAAFLKVKQAAAKGSPKAKALLETAKRIDATVDAPSKVVTARSGRKYRVTVEAAE